MTTNTRLRWWWRLLLLGMPAAGWWGYVASTDPFAHYTLLETPGVRVCQSCLVIGAYPFVPDVSHVFDPIDITGPNQPEGTRVFMDLPGPKVVPEYADYMRYSEALDRARQRGAAWASWSDGSAFGVAFWLLLPLTHVAAVPLLTGLRRQRLARQPK